MLRRELCARDIEEIDSKTHAVSRPLAEVRDARGIERSLPRLVDTAVGRQHLRLGAWLGGRWLLRPDDGLLAALGARAVGSVAIGSRFEPTRDAGRT